MANASGIDGTGELLPMPASKIHLQPSACVDRTADQEHALAHPNLNLTPEEKRLFGQLFQAADTENVGVVTGEVAVKFFEKSRLEPRVLGEIWQIADTENRGFLTPAGFGLVLRLIGHVQNGRDPTSQLALRPGPLPKFEGFPAGPNQPPPLSSQPSLQPQLSGSGLIRVPPFNPDKVNEFSSLFERSGAANGVLSGEQAREIFEKARLPNEVLGKIWSLADTEQRGALGVTEFVIAMHLLASYKSGALRALPNILPPGLIEAAARRTAPSRPAPYGGSATGTRTSNVPPNVAIPRQFSGSGPHRTQSPLNRPGYGAPSPGPLSAGGDWLIAARDKAQFDSVFATLDKANRGFITGEEAVPFFSNSRLPEEILAQIWDLADINSEGHLNRDEFAVAMYLIRQQRGTRDGRGTLPSSLPPKLIPPSMRQQIRPPQQPTAPAFDNDAHATTKSASEDLFGLDAFAPAAPTQEPMATGNSAMYGSATDGDPFNKPSSPVPSQGLVPASPPQQQSTFKPFVPSSSFGQTILNPQATGGSNGSRPSQPQSVAQPQASNMDDLLGDNDPEVSKKLTAETSELANLSNQVGTLSSQMQEVKVKRSSTEQNLAQAGEQKRQFEQRLLQLRSLYEQEVKDVKSLEDRLHSSRTETRKLQQDLAMLEGTHADLSTQHQQLTEALSADQGENASLKERIRGINAEIDSLKPQLDRLRSEARQQKGLVAINKKQLSTSEGERDRLHGEVRDASRAASEDATQGEAALPSSRGPSALTSPAPSSASQSMNPFFRKSSTNTSDNPVSPTSYNPGSSTGPQAYQNSFDNVFGPSFSSTPSGGPPPTSFRQDAQTSGTAAAGYNAADTSDVGAVDPPNSSIYDSPQSAQSPPPPPGSRQITSSLLPFRNDMRREESPSSSVKVSAPSSRYGGQDDSRSEESAEFVGPEVETPRQEMSSQSRGLGGSDRAPEEPIRDILPQGGSTGRSSAARAQPEPPTYHTNNENNAFEEFEATHTPKDSMPGGFPMEPASAIHTPTGASTPSEPSNDRNQPAGSLSGDKKFPLGMGLDQPQRANSNKSEDFDAAFAGFPKPAGFTDGPRNGMLEGAAATDTGPQQTNGGEFPPIQEFGDDDDTDSPDERGFEDDFTPTSPQGQHRDNIGTVGQTPQASATIGHGDSSNDPFAQGPLTKQMELGANDQLPTPGAQNSPPTYNQTMSPTNGTPHDPNQFPPEFTGLLPARQDPTSPSAGGTSGASHNNRTPVDDAQSNMGSGTRSADVSFPSSGPMDATPASFSPPLASSTSQVGNNQVPRPSKVASEDDFERDFADLADAQEEIDKTEFGESSRTGDGFDDFNPMFDSPAPSKASALPQHQSPMGSTGPGDGSIEPFGQKRGDTVGSSSGPAVGTAASTQGTASHDWDAIFAGLDTPTGSIPGGVPGGASQPVVSPSTQLNFAGGSSEAGPSTSQIGGATVAGSSSGQRPGLGRALTTGTEHDDPILKKLTGMGYARAAALDALERYDYNLDKAADHLVRQSGK
ncbi:MAG: hypothetical protein M1817_004712 [Caeruleum heppii]|nr:MAG: hypothetical protein M1817_004712 [Caeruleum heppii]